MGLEIVELIDNTGLIYKSPRFTGIFNIKVSALERIF